MSFVKFLGPEVASLARQVESSGERMKGASRELSNAHAAHFGTAELESACDDFAGSWEYGLGKLSDMTKGVADFAAEAASAFDEAERELERSLKEAGQ